MIDQKSKFGVPEIKPAIKDKVELPKGGTFDKINKLAAKSFSTNQLNLNDVLKLKCKHIILNLN